MDVQQYYYSKHKLLLSAVAYFIFFFVLEYVLIFRFDVDIVVKGVIIALISVICITLFARTLNQFTERRAILTVSDDGFRDLRVSEDQIGWKFIKSIKLVEGRGGATIHFDTVLSKDQYMKLEGQNAWGAFNNSIYIQTAWLNASASDIERALRAKFRKTELVGGTSSDLPKAGASKTYKRLTQIEGAIFVVCMCYMAYGFINFPDAPIQSCYIDQYCGKFKHLHSISEYTSAKKWETGILILWPTAIVTSLIVRSIKKKY